MCNVCTRSWIPANHRASHFMQPWADAFITGRIHGIANPLAELKRLRGIESPRWTKRNGMREKADWINKYRTK